MGFGVFDWCEISCQTLYLIWGKITVVQQITKITLNCYKLTKYYL